MIPEDFRFSPNMWFHEAYRTSHQDLLEFNADEALKVKDRLVQQAHFKEQIRTYFNTAVISTSWFRCPELNGRVGGSAQSYHKHGLADDFYVLGKRTNRGIRETIHVIRYVLKIPFGKLIDEMDKKGNRWIHMSLGLPYRPSELCGLVFRMRNGVYEPLP